MIVPRLSLDQMHLIALRRRLRRRMRLRDQRLSADIELQNVKLALERLAPGMRGAYLEQRAQLLAAHLMGDGRAGD